MWLERGWALWGGNIRVASMRRVKGLDKHGDNNGQEGKKRKRKEKSCKELRLF